MAGKYGALLGRGKKKCIWEGHHVLYISPGHPSQVVLFQGLQFFKRQRSFAPKFIFISLKASIGLNGWE